MRKRSLDPKNLHCKNLAALAQCTWPGFHHEIRLVRGTREPGPIGARFAHEATLGHRASVVRVSKNPNF